jgi:hypothetical protein
MLGGMALASMKTMDPVKDSIHEGEVPRKLLDEKVLESAYYDQVKRALSDFARELHGSYKQDLKRFEKLITKKRERQQMAEGVGEAESAELETS